MAVRIVTDSTADLQPELARELGISVVPVYVRFGDESYRDGVDISHDEFYNKLVTSPVHPATSQPTPADFAEVYRNLSKETDDIVSVHVSSKLSGTYASALQGKEIAATGNRITVLDSFSVSMGLGMISLAAARVAAAGGTLQKVTEEIRHAIESTHLMGVFDTLKYLLRGGRIGKAKALVGSVLNVKPILTLRDGELLPIGNVRTRTRGVEKLVEFVKSSLGIQELAVIHTTSLEDARGLKARLSSLVDASRLHLTNLGPALGAHGGPGMLAVAFRDGTPGNKIQAESKLGQKLHVPSLHVPKIHLPHPHLRSPNSTP